MTAPIAIATTPAGNVANGETQHTKSCAVCHGTTGHGTDANPDGSFTIEGVSYAFPAPGLDAESGNAGSDPAWNGAVFAQAARGDFYDDGVGHACRCRAGSPTPRRARARCSRRRTSRTSTRTCQTQTQTQTQ